MIFLAVTDQFPKSNLLLLQPLLALAEQTCCVFLAMFRDFDYWIKTFERVIESLEFDIQYQATVSASADQPVQFLEAAVQPHRLVHVLLQEFHQPRIHVNSRVDARVRPLLIGADADQVTILFVR